MVLKHWEKRVRTLYFTLFTLIYIQLWGSNLIGQNYFPNPDFSKNTSCPTNFSQLILVSDWENFSATSDYYACTFQGNPTVFGASTDGTGVIGTWGGSGHPSCPGGGYSERVRASLSSPLEIGTSYDLSFDLQIDGHGSSSGTPNNCMRFGFYFYDSNTTNPTSSICCMNEEPQYSIDGTAVVQGSYTRFQYSFVPTIAYDKVIIGAFCNANTPTAGCGDYAIKRMYFNLDRVELSKSVVLEIGNIDPKEIISAADPTIYFYPNPSPGASRLSLGLSEETQLLFEVLDLQGTKVGAFWHTFNPLGEDPQVDLRALPAGMYIVRISKIERKNSILLHNIPFMKL